jgi:lipopolysaccharide heptosyltransferase I
MSNPGNILAIRLSSLGDVLMTVPAVKAIKEAAPESRISWLVEGPVGDLLANQGFIDRVVRFPRSFIVSSMKTGKIIAALRGLLIFIKELRDSKYDVIVDFHGIIKSGFFSILARGKTVIGFDRTFAKEGSWIVYDKRIGGPRRSHKVERNMLLAREIGANGTVPEVILSVPPEADAVALRFFQEEGIDGPVIAVNPFCSKGSAFKRWRLENYAALINRIHTELPLTAVIVWGPGEGEEAKRLREMAGGRTRVICPTNVAQLCALLKRVNLYVGGDTGGMHLAVFAGVPVVALFGPTDVMVNGPWGEKTMVVRKGADCSPCRDKGCQNRICLESLTVDDAFHAVAEMWERISRN